MTSKTNKVLSIIIRGAIIAIGMFVLLATLLVLMLFCGWLYMKVLGG